MNKGIEVPRIYTPPLRELTPDTSLGFEVIEFADKVLHIELMPWQKWLAIHSLEVVDDPVDGWRLRFRIVVTEVGRQNGKTSLGCVIALYFLYQLMVGLVLGTAQDVSNAEDTWQMCVEIAENNPELSEAIKHVWYTNGAKRLQLNGNRDYRVRASNRKAGRGKSADLVLMDELREHQTWDAWAALSKTGMARKNALMWCMSNAGDGTSVVLRHFRLKAHARLGDPDGIVAAMGDSAILPDEEDIEDSALGWFEWSAHPNADPGDEKEWAQANPALGYTIELNTIRAAKADDPIDVFKTECLCQWVETTIAPPFPVDAWDAGKDENSTIAAESPLWWGVDIASDRTRASIAVCGKRKDGHWHVELAEYRAGTGWLAGWFMKAASNYKSMKVALQSRGAPIASMMDVIAAIDGVEIIECAGKDVAGWCGRMWDAVASCLPDSETDATPVHHITQPALDLAANIAATRPMGDGAWAWDRNKSIEDISPLVAATMAFGSATQLEVPKTKMHDSVYQERGVIVL